MTPQALFARPADDGPAQGLFAQRPFQAGLEWAAYEALWRREGMWFGPLARLFEQHPGALPSELVDGSELEEAQARLIKLLPNLAPFGIRLHGAGEYPLRLRDADHPVELLYYRGDWTLAEAPSVAIVGTREPSDTGRQQAKRIATTLVREGFVVTSGLARGIDTAAHTAALEAGGATIGVVGTPLNESYPAENAKLQRHIAEEHLLISQVPFLRYAESPFNSRKLYFPARNVTMAALTQATIIVEAGNTSGTLTQARAALSQGRKLLILESCFRNPSLNWPNKYERLGAIRVGSVSDILRVLKDQDAAKQ